MISPETFDDGLEFKWKIKKFSMYPHKPGEAIQSPLLSVGSPCHSIVYLKLYPTGWNQPSRHIVAADLIRMEGSFKGRLVCQISIVAGDGSTLEGQISTNCSSILWNRNTAAKHAGRWVLDQEEFVKLFLPNDTLIVRCKIVIHSIPRHFAADLIALSEKLNSLYDSKVHSDLTLCTNDTKFKVHNFILNHRAPDFLKDLGLQFGNSENECIQINGISTPVLQSLIQYMYNGKLKDLPPANVPEILEIAKKYGMNTQNFVELTDEVIDLGPPFTISTNIQVHNRKINWNIPSETLNMSASHCLVQRIFIGPFIFLLKLNINERSTCISFKCLSMLKENIFMGCKVFAGIRDIEDWFSLDYYKLQFLVDGLTEMELPGEFLQSYHFEIGLRLQLLISVSDCMELVSVKSEMFLFPEVPSQYSLSFLHNSMISLFNRTQIDDSGDVTLVIENTPIKAHKAILATWSPVIDDIFNNMVDKNDEVQILDVDYDTALRLVKFIYCGTVTKQSFKEDSKLYVAANKYQVSTLFTKCSSFLESHLAPSNVCDIAMLAYTHTDDLLLASARRVFFSNREAVKISNEWRSLSDSDPHFSSMMQQPI